MALCHSTSLTASENDFGSSGEATTVRERGTLGLVTPCLDLVIMGCLEGGTIEEGITEGEGSEVEEEEEDKISGVETIELKVGIGCVGIGVAMGIAGERNSQ